MKIIKKSIISIIFFLVILGVALVSLRNNRKDFNLTITSSESDAVIAINNKTYSGQFRELLPKNIYKFTVEKDGFITENREVNLNKDIKIEITLIQKLGEISNIPSKDISTSLNTTLTYDGSTISYDPTKRNLNLFRDGKSYVIYTGIPKFFTISGDFVVVANNSTKKSLFLINTKNFEKTEIDTSIISPVVYATFNPIENSIWILGKYNNSTRTSTIYVKSLNNPEFVQSYSTSANKIEIINSTQVVLFEKIDHPNASFIQVYDKTTDRVVVKTQGNDYLLSPSKDQLAVLAEDKISIFDLKNFSKKDVPFNYTNKIAWRDDTSFIALKNVQDKVVYYMIDSQYGGKTSEHEIEELGNVVIRKIVGRSDDSLYLEDTTNKIWKIELF